MTADSAPRVSAARLATVSTGAARVDAGVRGVTLAAGISALDRLLIAPLIVPAARDLRVSIGVMAIAATAHFLAYGAAQTVHGLASDRFGRIRVLWVALIGLGAANLASAAAPSAGWLIAARGMAGAASAGLVPGALVYLADALPAGVRNRAQIGVSGALGIGTAASLLAGVLAAGPGWRAAFLATGLVAGALGLWLRGVREPPRPAAQPHPAPPPHRALGHALRSRWLRRVAALAVPEGAAVFGFVAFLSPALEHAGHRTAVAGLATGAVGAGLALGTIAVRRLYATLTDTVMAGVGATIVAAAYLSATADQLVIVLVAAAMAGVGQAALHSTLQRWAVAAVPDARGTATAIFATGAFAGAGVAALIAVPLTTRGAYPALFWIAAATAMVTAVGIAAGWARPRFSSPSAAEFSPG